MIRFSCRVGGPQEAHCGVREPGHEEAALVALFLTACDSAAAAPGPVEGRDRHAARDRRRLRRCRPVHARPQALPERVGSR